MRNLKKYLAVVVAIAIMMTAMIPAFAADTTAATTIPTDAKICADLGVLKGSGSGVTTEYLAGSVDRMQAARLYLRLKGLEQDALATVVDAANFPDADKTNADGKKVMAYLKAHPENGFVGGDSGNFGPKDTMTAQAYYKVLLTALGYAQKTSAGVGDFDYKDTFTFAATKGLSKVATVTDFTRADFATASVEALKATVKGKTKTLVATLVEAGKIDKAAAVAAGLYVDVPEKIEVSSVAADNLKQVVVTFNSAIDKTTAENKDNYKIDNFVFDGAKLSEDAKTVTLTLDQSEAVKFTNQKEYKITIDGLKDAAGNKIAKTDKYAFTPVDTTIPTVSSVEALGTKAVKIVFSEPVKSSTATMMGNYKIDGKSIAGIIKYSFSNSVIIQTTLTVGEHTLSVDGVADFYDYKANAKNLTFTVAEDKEAPVIESITAKDLTEVEVIFNEPVKGVTKAYHTSDSKTATIKISDKKVTLTFATDKRLPATQATITLKDVEDYSGNKATREAAVTPNLDTERPTVTNVKADAVDGKHKFTIEFSENVKTEDATKGANYTLKDKDGKAISGKGLNTDGHPSTVTYDSSKKQSTFTLSTTLDGGTYTVEVSGISDVSYVGNTMMPYSTTLEIKSANLPTIVKAWIEQVDVSGTSPRQYEAKLYVKYSADMSTEGTGSVLEYTKYTYSTSYPATPSWLPVPKDSDVSLSTSDTVVITLPRSTTDYRTTAKGVRVTLVSDKNDNFINNYVGDKAISNGVGVIAINSAKAIDKKTIEVEFNGVLSNVDDSDFTANGKDITQDSEISSKDGKSTVKFIFKDGYELDSNAAGGAGIFTVKPGINAATQDSNGAKVTGYHPITDAIRPGIKDVQLNGAARAFELKKDATNHYIVYVYTDENIYVNANAADVLDVNYDGNKLKVVSVSAQNYVAAAGATPEVPSALVIDLGTALRKDNGTPILTSAIVATNTIEVVVKSANNDMKYIKDADGEGVAVDTTNKIEAIQNVVASGVDAFVTAMKNAATAAVDADDLLAATNEAAKYADTVNIPGTTLKDADVTGIVKALISGKTADTSVGVSISIASPVYLRLTGDVVTLASRNNTAAPVNETVTLTFTKGTQTATRTVTVAIAVGI